MSLFFKYLANHCLKAATMTIMSLIGVAKQNEHETPR